MNSKPRYTMHFVAGWYILDNDTGHEVGKDSNTPMTRSKALTAWIVDGLNGRTILLSDLEKNNVQ